MGNRGLIYFKKLCSCLRQQMGKKNSVPEHGVDNANEKDFNVLNKSY